LVPSPCEGDGQRRGVPANVSGDVIRNNAQIMAGWARQFMIFTL
jgi:hypothetical protein